MSTVIINKTKTETEKVYIVIGQTFFESIISDLFTLGALALLIYLSVHLGSGFWQVFACLVFLVGLAGKVVNVSGHGLRFKDKAELREWATPQAHESVQNGTCDDTEA